MKRPRSIARGVLTGSVAGLVGCLAMAGFQELVVRASTHGNDVDHGQHAPSSAEESTTEKAARSVARQFGRRLSVDEKQLAGRGLHYGFGTLMGAAYGATAEYLPVLGSGAGVAFGTVLFLSTDEAVLPLLNLASKPTETPATDHLLHWASHVVYSMAMETTRRALTRMS